MVHSCAGGIPRTLDSAVDTKLLIDSIVRQTTLLIANLATAAGVRAPLAHVADQVFLELSREIESQGVSRKVAADMFGMALRTYQKRVQRIAESVTDSQQTLWSAVLDYIVENDSIQRSDIMHRFRYDGDSQVASVLNDLVSSGFIYRTGRGDSTVYAPTDEKDYEKFVKSNRESTLADLVWVHIYRNPAVTEDELVAGMPFDEDEVRSALEVAIADGRISRLYGDEKVPRLRAGVMHVPVGSKKGWEAAVFDHYQALCTAVSRKVNEGIVQSQHGDRIGGATLSFDVYPGHPYEQQAYGLLDRIRSDVNLLWMAVSRYNADNPVPEDEKTKVVFYFGQYVSDSSESQTGMYDAIHDDELDEG